MRSRRKTGVILAEFLGNTMIMFLAGYYEVWSNGQVPQAWLYYQDMAKLNYSSLILSIGSKLSIRLSSVNFRSRVYLTIYRNTRPREHTHLQSILSLAQVRFADKTLPIVLSLSFRSYCNRAELQEANADVVLNKQHFLLHSKAVKYHSLSEWISTKQSTRQTSSPPKGWWQSSRAAAAVRIPL